MMSDPVTEPTALDHARALARRGFRVLPIRPGGKHPPMAAWQDAATTRPEALQAWWNGLYRDCGVGIATGHLDDGTAFFVLDVDDRDTYNGSDTLAELEHRYGKLPDTVTSITGSGGEHRFLVVPPGRECPRNDQSGKLGPGLDIRGEGGQVVVAPTVHPNGTAYQWEADHAPGQIAMAEAPGWLLDLLAPEPAKAPRVQATGPRDAFMLATSPADRYNERTTWAQLLLGDGWQHSYDRDDEEYWTRPGKETRDGVSATIGWRGNDALKVFTSAPEVGWLQADHTYSRFQYMAHRDHGGDMSAAARAVIAAEGHQVPVHLPIVPVGTQAPETPPEAAVDAYDTDLRAMITDWPTFWRREAAEAQWLMEPVFAEKRAHAFYAPGGTGKSLFVLWLCAALASGRQGLDGQPVAPRRVLYLDYEMTPEDVRERLESMGYDDTCDLSRLSYAILPSLPPADAPEGGKAIARMAQLVDAELVVLDTFSRAVSGDENDADTVRDFYRWTGMHLKAEGRAFCRVDHAGKDLDKGQRGSSAKNDDVDVVWQMTKADNGFKLIAKKRRMGWIPEEVALLQYDEPSLHYKVVEQVAPAGTSKVVDDLDELDVPPSASARQAEAALKEAKRGARGQVVRAAQKHRSNRIWGGTHPRDAVKFNTSDDLLGRTGTHSDIQASDQGLSAGTHPGTRWDAPSDASGTRPPPLKGDAPSVTETAEPTKEPEPPW